LSLFLHHTLELRPQQQSLSTSINAICLWIVFSVSHFSLASFALCISVEALSLPN
jgi:hypothetical protein